MEISPKQVERLTERLGCEWAAKRDHDVELFKQDRLPRQYTQAPAAAAVMLDGGRMLTRTDQGRPGVHQPAWREPKYACCLSLEAKRSLLIDREKCVALAEQAGIFICGLAVAKTND